MEEIWGAGMIMHQIEVVSLLCICIVHVQAFNFIAFSIQLEYHI